MLHLCIIFSGSAAQCWLWPRLIKCEFQDINYATFMYYFLWLCSPVLAMASSYQMRIPGHKLCYIYVLFSLGLQPSAGYGLLVTRGFLITHNDTPQSVGLLWTSDQSVAETST
jgi:hypothetical protein